MSNKYKCVQINLEESLYNHFIKYIDSYIPNTDISYFLKCLVINRSIELGILNEIGMPNEIIFGPKIDISSLSDPSDIWAPDISAGLFDLPAKEFAEKGEPYAR